MKTRTLVVILLGLTLAAGCKNKETDKAPATAPVTKPIEDSVKPPEPPKPAPKTGKELAQVYLECAALMDGGKVDDYLNQCIADNFVAHEADGEDRKRDALAPMLKELRSAFPDMKASPQLVLVNGRNVIAVVLTTGTHEGTMKTPMGDVPPTKKKVGVFMYHRFAINDENKITEEWMYYDPTTFMGQLGLLPKSAPPVRPAADQGMPGAPVIIVAADDEKERANLAATKAAGETFNSHKLADELAAYSDDVVESDQAGPADAKGTKQFEASVLGFWKAFPDAKVAVSNQWAAGDYVVSEGVFSGTNDGPLGPLPKTGKKVSAQYVEVTKVKDGKLAEVWRFRSGMALAMQLGLLGPPPGDAKAPKK